MMTIDLSETPELAAARAFFAEPSTEIAFKVTPEKQFGIYDYFNCGSFRILTVRPNEHAALIKALLNSVTKLPNSHPALSR